MSASFLARVARGALLVVVVAVAYNGNAIPPDHTGEAPAGARRMP